MEQRFGDRSRFAIEVGEATPYALRPIDVWAAGIHLTVDDNAAYVSSWCPHMQHIAEKVGRRETEANPFPGRTPEDVFRAFEQDKIGFMQQRFWFLNGDETFDNLSNWAYLENDELVLIFGFWRDTHPFPEQLGEIYTVRLAPDEFVSVVTAAIDYLGVAGSGGT